MIFLLWSFKVLKISTDVNYEFILSLSLFLISTIANTAMEDLASLLSQASQAPATDTQQNYKKETIKKSIFCDNRWT